MRDLRESAKLTEKMSLKILKMLENVGDPEAFATLNYCFTKMLVQRMDDVQMMRAALLTFMVNTSSSIDRVFEIEDTEDEHIH